MKRISQGKFEVFTTRADAIDKFIQMQGICREEISGENSIEFYCLKNGKIIITNPPTRRVESENSTQLFAEIVEQNGKTYVTYHTSFDTSNNVLKRIFLVLYIIMAVAAIILAVINGEKTASFIVLAICLAFFVFKLSADSKEKINSPKDSEILINELKKRVDAVNLWDK